MKGHTAKLDLPPARGDETIFEFVVSDTGQWEHWRERVEEYIYPSDTIPDFSSILVPNVDNVRTNFLIETISKQYKVRRAAAVSSSIVAGRGGVKQHNDTPFFHCRPCC